MFENYRTGVSWTARRRAVSLAIISCAIAAASLVEPSHAALVVGSTAASILFGRDEDNVSNPAIQPAGVAANQSLNNADVLVGRSGNDVLIGLLGSDVLSSGGGNDILIGGPEQGTTPNSDIQFGDDGDDIAIWAPGDGSDLFVGGTGRDAMVFGVIDKDGNNRPISGGSAPGFENIPSVNVSGQGGFCTIERADGTTGYEFLIRFFSRATGALLVTVRLNEVEQLFCTSQAGGQITYADLTQTAPQQVVISLGDALALNNTVGRMIR
jgi:RTX calcium-binding nonapeptide repeat (4 copies)